MAKVTSKRQITIPKALAERLRISEGDEVEFVETAYGIRLVPAGNVRAVMTVAERLALYDAATRRQAARQRRGHGHSRQHRSQGWTRDELYDS